MVSKKTADAFFEARFLELVLKKDTKTFPRNSIVSNVNVRLTFPVAIVSERQGRASFYLV